MATLPPSWRWQLSGVAFLIFAASTAAAAPRQLTELSLEELMEVEVVSVSKQPEPRFGAAAAIAVISNEDLRRSGVSTVPEALRASPGIHVGRITSNDWAVSSRGFANLNSAKLLVLADGRSIYTPLFSGVFWDVQDFLFEDLDRIEVVRGPGGTLWGANAVNGVINIVSKTARQTQGTYLEAGGGTEERAFGSVRYGGHVGENLHYRIYAKYADRDEGYDPLDRDDDWQMARTGFRADWTVSARDTLTLQGDLYQGESGQVLPALVLTGLEPPTAPLEVDFSGGNVLGRWQRRFGADAYLHFQTYYDRTYRDDATFVDTLDTFDVQIEQSLKTWWNQQWLFGVNYRLMADNFIGRLGIHLEPQRSQDHLFSGLIQDQFRLWDEAVELTLGTKIEHNDFSGFEVQPSARLAWHPVRPAMFWSAVSRAVRVPTRIERDITARTSDPGSGLAIALQGGPSLTAETLTSFELGHRLEVTPQLNLDIAGFYNNYESLITFEATGPETNPEGVPELTIFNENRMDGEAHGAEVAATWYPRPWARLMASYSYLDVSLEPDTGSLDINNNEALEDASPRNQVGLRSYLDLPADFQLDSMFRYIDRLRQSADGSGAIPKYLTLDVRLAWLGWNGLELAVVGQNLLEQRHREFAGGSRIERGVYGKLSYRF